jgi:predicted RND superfamily exporter protein
MKRGITEFSIKHPRLVLLIAVAVTIFFALQFPGIMIDTDPENMLAEDEPVRIFHQLTKENFSLYDFVALGVVEEDGAFTPELLNRIYRITADIEEIEGVIVEDMLALSMVDDIKQGDGGGLVIGTLMEDEISTAEEAEYIYGRILENPILRGKLASDDGKAIALFIPIESKDMSYRIAGEIREITQRHGGGEKYHIAGLPVAQDSFGAEMFYQMAYSAPAAMIIIFLLMLLFFRNIRIILAPMVVAMMTVIWSMGLLIMTGNTVHIMSSMIPIFLIPIAVLDSIHIVSEYHDNFKKSRDRHIVFKTTHKELFLPMLLTSLTTMVGFVSLTVTPIPPVQVFGVFVAFGIGVAWILSLTINPAVGMLISDKTLQNFGREGETGKLLAAGMNLFRNLAQRRYTAIISISLVVMVAAGIGLSLIEVNDNPVKWFKKSHPIRQADILMNEHLAGTYMNYLVFEGDEDDVLKDPAVLNYIESVQNELIKESIVGATTGVTDVIKKVRYELFGADRSEMIIPDNRDEVAQMLFLFEMSGGDPDDLFKFVTNDYMQANLWVQLTDGDNQSVSRVVARVNNFMVSNPPPTGIDVRWTGLPYINIEWQHQMVKGMQSALLGAYVIVFMMMILLFRSFKWGLISMLPLTITIMAIYGFIGYIGKPYDMPIAILSSLTLGLSIDFSIHFIQRLRMIHKRTGNFEESFQEIFKGTGEAISRNVMVISIGFVPLLFSNLVPYVTVGSFFLAIMLVSGTVTMLLLPAVVQAFDRKLLPCEVGAGGGEETEVEEITDEISDTNGKESNNEEADILSDDDADRIPDDRGDE